MSLRAPLTSAFSSWTYVVVVLFAQCFLHLVLKAIYNIHFHPLRKYPGPWWLAASRIPHTISVLRGRATRESKYLHERYGHVVRINPDTLSFTCSTAWVDIYGLQQPNGRGNIPKDPLFYLESRKAPLDAEGHRRLRRTQAYAFSERAVSQQEVCLQQYTAFFINRLFESRHNSPSGIIDLAQWINLLTTDIAGDLTLGESFRGLEDGKIHPWLRNIQWTTKVFAFIRESSRYPGVLRAIGACCPRNKEDKQESFIARAVAKRFDMGTDRPDLMSCIIEAASEGRVSQNEMEAVAVTFLIAGSETTATLLTGSIYLLCKHPLVMQQLTIILRTQFRSASEMTLLALQAQDYLNAVLQESLRLYPPAPGNLFRRTAAEGHIVMGEAVPPNTSLTMNLWAANCSGLNFYRPDDMVPERWLKSRPAEFEDDDRDVVKPFSMRPHDCPGKNLAWAEMRLVLAQMLWHFDFELTPESDGWINRQKVFLFWEKPPLKVKITAAARERPVS
ncbi:isotrichodermin C-15 hydroxylase [Ilyonectria robusta]|uniref:isotrichodermin C-15 hydroxylase n=1 Tax=Ilyonectria robusta TaxID=1079257 RepID=UPI001E8D13D2|nr:isotrichodermin C-15 hydroxylase [Ilyonectria robusta]KAH8663891.1 isotrichodermin C-15 hydroxylase [Ilyonectria robusta]